MDATLLNLLKKPKICVVCKKEYIRNPVVSYKSFYNSKTCSITCRGKYFIGRKHKPHRTKTTSVERFMHRVNINEYTGCWEWTGFTSKGYGKFFHQSKARLASRVIWEWINGEIPEGLYICHSCDNPKCVNVEYLFLGTPRDNVVDMYKKGRHKINVIK